MAETADLPDNFEVVDTPKYKDQDILNHPSLQVAAMQYLINYKGTFIFLNRSRNELLRSGKLSVATVRGVVNCMRQRPELMHGLPEPGTPIELKPHIILIPEAAQAERIEEERKRPPFIGVKAHFNHEYFWKPFDPNWRDFPKMKQPVFHKVDASRTICRWYTAEQKLFIIPRSMCGYTLTEWRSGKRAPEDSRLCGTCARRSGTLDAVNTIRPPAFSAANGDVLSD